MTKLEQLLQICKDIWNHPYNKTRISKIERAWSTCSILPSNHLKMVTQISNNEFLVHMLGEHIEKKEGHRRTTLLSIRLFCRGFMSVCFFFLTFNALSDRSWEALEMENFNVNPDLAGIHFLRMKKRKHYSNLPCHYPSKYPIYHKNCGSWVTD